MKRIIHVNFSSMLHIHENLFQRVIDPLIYFNPHPLDNMVLQNQEKIFNFVIMLRTLYSHNSLMQTLYSGTNCTPIENDGP